MAAMNIDGAESDAHMDGQSQDYRHQFDEIHGQAQKELHKQL